MINFIPCLTSQHPLITSCHLLSPHVMSPPVLLSHSAPSPLSQQGRHHRNIMTFPQDLWNQLILNSKKQEIGTHGDPTLQRSSRSLRVSAWEMEDRIGNNEVGGGDTCGEDQTQKDQLGKPIH